MRKNIFPHTRIGILGGGQLGLMLLEVATRWGLDVSILDPDPNAPCSAFCKKFVLGDYRDKDTVLQFAKNLDLLTIEIESVNIQALEELADQGLAVHPSPAVIRTIQDKLTQKQFFKKYGIPNSDFIAVQNTKELNQRTDFLPCFQKLRWGGYDGHGVRKLASLEDIQNAFNAPSILEKSVNIAHEISILVARNIYGEATTYPAVEMVFSKNAHLVEFLVAPARLPEPVLQEAKQLAIECAHHLSHTGILAVEMFVTSQQSILVNEMAPRPHNSGHHTMETNSVSQFEQHWRAILGLPLGDTRPRCAAAMLNLLGHPGESGFVQLEGHLEALQDPRVALHLYGKSVTRPYRKMGHLTITDDNIDSALNFAKEMKSKLLIRGIQHT